MKKATLILDGVTNEIILKDFDEYYTNINFLTFNWRNKTTGNISQQCIYSLTKILEVKIELELEEPTK
jgi:hypothetical protein